ncbi:hypothetical protein N4G70_06225 [Streptomyces sp. ASQP_92]|uniref:hypothetical protein n=1 Tax=Streptomyces sp. ASQP_92 TaxID=2979116 RepID=UPI0021C23510|nr:hypothetical protein [Streptomyces sp. ASQP_92]MCT9088463.1 hypothetical protein [Streptomyces sp. ASQP_92]
MHRTPNTLRLLAAVTALSLSGCLVGCVSVEADRAPAPPSGPPAVPRPQATARIAQAPAREALETVMPPDAASSPPTAAAPAPEEPARPDPPRRGRRPGAERTGGRPAAPRTKRHPRTAPAPAAPAGICALGQAYGGWRDDSPQARICRETYGS